MLTRHAHKDEPVTDARLALVLDAAAAPAEPGPAPGEQAALAAFRASSVRADGWRSRMHTPTTPRKTLAVTAASAGLLLTGGFAAAAAGELPGAAQQTAHDMLATINVEVPGADEHSDGHADTRGRSEDAPPAGGGADAADTVPEAAAHGQMISDLARSPSWKASTRAWRSRRRPEAMARRASTATRRHRRSRRGAATGPWRQRPRPRLRATVARAVITLGSRRRTTAGPAPADDASTDDGGGASTQGTGAAGDMSGGRSADGSGNAADRPEPITPR